MVNPALIHLLDINPVEIQNNISKDNFNINEVGIAHNMMHNLKENNIKILGHGFDLKESFRHRK